MEEAGAAADAMEPVLAALFAEAATGRGALGVADLTVEALLTCVIDGSPPRAALGQALDSFVEVQIHGTVRLDRDVERLVADPAFRGDAVGDLLAALCARHRIPLDWHPGYALPADEFPDEFRGHRVRSLARRIAAHGLVDPAAIGRAENSLRSDPRLRQDWGIDDATATHFRRIWHALVAHGRPAPDQPPDPTNGGTTLTAGPAAAPPAARR
jgi:hypothetical protein